MSLTTLESQIETVRANAKTEQSNLTRATATVNADPNLSEEGKKAETAALREQSKVRLTALREEEKRLLSDAITARQRQIDGLTGTSAADIIAFRDAQDRAERVDTPSEARAILDRALRTGDPTLANAVFRRALDARWKEVINTYTAAHPAIADAANELQTLTEAQDNSFERTLAYAAF